MIDGFRRGIHFVCHSAFTQTNTHTHTYSPIPGQIRKQTIKNNQSNLLPPHWHWWNVHGKIYTRKKKNKTRREKNRSENLMRVRNMWVWESYLNGTPVIGGRDVKLGIERHVLFYWSKISHWISFSSHPSDFSSYSWYYQILFSVLSIPLLFGAVLNAKIWWSHISLATPSTF